MCSSQKQVQMCLENNGHYIRRYLVQIIVNLTILKDVSNLRLPQRQVCSLLKDIRILVPLVNIFKASTSVMSPENGSAIQNSELHWDPQHFRYICRDAVRVIPARH